LYRYVWSVALVDITGPSTGKSCGYNTIFETSNSLSTFCLLPLQTTATPPSEVQSTSDMAERQRTRARSGGGDLAPGMLKRSHISRKVTGGSGGCEMCEGGGGPGRRCWLGGVKVLKPCGAGLWCVLCEVSGVASTTCDESYVTNQGCVLFVHMTGDNIDTHCW
jgi:hypothetical protein